MASQVLPPQYGGDVIRAEKNFDEEAGPIEWVLTQLFQKFPENTDFGEVLVKTKVLNVLYSAQIRAVNVVARHICSLAIDPDLTAGKPEIVDRIARVQLSDRIRNNCSFASKLQRRSLSLALRETRGSFADALAERGIAFPGMVTTTRSLCGS